MKTTDDQNELFIVVDTNDTILGYKTRRECHQNPSLIHRAVGVLVFNDNDELLLQKRSQTKDKNPGLWTLSAGGHVAKGQTYQEAAERELYEEIGIYAPLEKITTYLYKGKDEQEMDTLFKTYHNGPFNLNRDEVESVAFYPLDTLNTLVDSLTSCAKSGLREAGLLP